MATEEAVTGTRAHILAAAEQLIRDRGLKATTTRAIAEIAKCAEGSIYRYFPDKHAIIHEIVRTRFPEFLTLVETLPERAGTGTVRKNLEQLAVGALGFYRVILPITFGVMADRELLAASGYRSSTTAPLSAERWIASTTRTAARPSSSVASGWMPLATQAIRPTMRPYRPRVVFLVAVSR